MAEKLKRGANKEISREELAKGIKKIEKIEADRRSAKSAYARNDATKQDLIATEKEKLESSGAALPAVNAVLAVRSLEGKIKDARNKLEPPMRDLFDSYMKMTKDIPIAELVEPNPGKGSGKGPSAADADEEHAH